ncbi:MAG: S-layer homology domain-containing protein [Bacillaceae bacterium]|nr:S-layer homology domain-containing protein [Bacillaceae bacterium]
MGETSYKNFRNNNSQPNITRGGETQVMKKILNSILVFVLVLTMAVPAFAAEGEDLGDAAGAVYRLGALDVLQGYPDGTFRPDNTITRAEFAAVAVRLLGLEDAAEAAKGTTQFDDYVDAWATGYINIAVQQGVLKGYPDNTIRANNPVTQAEALTILVRALGYEPTVDEAGWPYNYIVKANQIGLTDGLNVSANAPATRGFVAMSSDNALTIPKMIQVGYGDSELYVVSGSYQNTDKETILENNLGYEGLTETVVNIPRTDSSLDDNEIELSSTGIVEVAEGFDFELAYGAEVEAFVADDMLIFAELTSDVLYDAVTYDSSANELTLVKADKDYDVASSVYADLYVNGTSTNWSSFSGADYAKVVLNDDNDVEFVSAFDWDGRVIVDEVDDAVIYSVDGEELDVEDYTIVKDGRTISVDDLNAGDVVFYNDGEEYAEVYNDYVTGEIGSVFTSSFKVDGEKYSYTQYVALSDVEDLEGNVTLYLDRYGDPVYIEGEEDETATDSFYGLLVRDVTTGTENVRGVNTNYFYVDVLTEGGEVVKYDLDQNDFPASVGSLTVGTVVKVTVDEDGEVTEITQLTTDTETDVALDETYAGAFKLDGDAVVFYTENATITSGEYEDTDDIKVFAWADAEDTFSEADVTAYGEEGVAVALVVNNSNADSDVETYTGLVTDVAKYAGENKWEITIAVAGEEETYVTSDSVTSLSVAVDDLATFDVGLDTGEIKTIAAATTTTGTVVDTTLADKTIEVTGAVYYELTSDAVIYDATDDYAELSLRDIQAGYTIEVFFDGDSNRFVDYVIVTAK